MNSSDSNSPFHLSEAGSTSGFSPLANWFQKFLIGNPFFLLSAGFLLYGINRFSVNPDFVGAEHAQLGFNFSVLLLYELLLVVTAVFIARLKVWEDTLLLVCLENLFLLVPFSLLSRAMFLEWKLAAAICAVGIVFGVAKFAALRRFIPELNFTQRFLFLGITLILANAILPVVFRNVEYHSIAARRWLLFFWLIVLPTLACLGNLLSSSRESSLTSIKYRWLKPVLFYIWILVTGGHLAGLAYTEDFAWETALTAPTFCAIAWTIRHQLGTSINAKAHRFSVVLPAVATLIAIPNTTIFSILSIVNASLYLIDFWRRKDRLLLAFALLSAAAAIAGLPFPVVNWLWPNVNRSLLVMMGTGMFWLTFSLYSRDPRASLPGAVVSMCIAAFSATSPDFLVFRVIQSGLVFVLLHSLRWRDVVDSSARHVRTVVAILWVLNSTGWLWKDVNAAMFVTGTTMAVLTLCLAIRWITKLWPSKIILLATGFNLAANLTIHGTRKAQSISPELSAILTAFVLFAFGTALAVAKHRWLKNQDAD